MYDISDKSLTAGLSACTMSPAAMSNDGASRCQDDSFHCFSAAADVDTSDDQTEVDRNADKITEKIISVMTVHEHSAVDSEAGCSSGTAVNQVGSSLPRSTCVEDVKNVEAVHAVLCLLHGLSHCSYHEPSLLLLTDHAAYRPVADLFVCLWHRLQASQHLNDKTLARIFSYLFFFKYLFLVNI